MYVCIAHNTIHTNNLFCLMTACYEIMICMILCFPFYVTGLITASVIADVYRAAQPALLYLVPGVLIPLFGKAVLQVCMMIHSTLC